MVKYLFDISLAILGLVLLAPLFGFVGLGIWITSPGPILYRARRVGLKGKIFTMYKFRTMHTNQSSFSSVISAKNDPRVFPVGGILRRYKVDELPQLFNIIKGEMSVVGPRAEDPSIVSNYYAQPHLATLEVRPGLVSPGSLYNYTHGEEQLDADDLKKSYLKNLLPVKLALDIVYVREASFLYNMAIIVRTGRTIISKCLGKCHFPDPPEMQRARSFIYPTKVE
jgi:lipopolysaccharide/colanic/teichoic acid biosynthesis glycosyltransferase